MGRHPPEAQRPFFRRVMKYAVEIVTEKENVSTGIVLSKDGIILTAYHGVKGCREITVRRCRLSEKTWNVIRFGRYEAELVYKDARSDIAVLRLVKPPKTLAAAILGFSDELKIGSAVFKVGRDDHPLASGHVIAFGKDDGVAEIEASMEGDCGASGGPVFNDRGRVVGMVVRASMAKSDPPVTFAIPINWIKTHILRRKRVREVLSSGDG